ncbi:hypothetical protein O2K51_12070 [Apibacter raozihei]|uniref:hypothetical protein n=1 Tax=Apibacter raozihei TaxID=2500547 RepID=UPI000FE42326|nr:hypothetical protein [Apibacter raozihei]
MKNYRRRLLPLWIKFFCWIFMVIGVLSILIMLIVSIGGIGFRPALSMYGIDSQQGNLSTLVIFITFVFNGIVAYMLWFGKRMAIRIAFINIIWTFLLCLTSMYVNYHYNSEFRIRFELICIIIFFIKIREVKFKWENKLTPDKENFL